MNKQFQYFAICFTVFLVIQNLMASGIWTLTSAPYNNWFPVAISADGNTLVVASDAGQIYVSRNSGAIWTACTNAPSANWVCVSISADGSKMIAGIDGGTIYTSNDYGLTWKPTKALGQFLGVYCLFCRWNQIGSGSIFRRFEQSGTWPNSPFSKFWSYLENATPFKKIPPILVGNCFVFRRL